MVERIVSRNHPQRQQGGKSARERGFFDILILISRLGTDQGRERPARPACTKMKAIVTVVGKDSVGIIAGVCQILAESGINILDISQTIMQGYFTMMMIVDISGAPVDFDGINQALEPIRDELKMEIHMQRMDIFDAMHRI